MEPPRARHVHGRVRAEENAALLEELEGLFLFFCGVCGVGVLMVVSCFSP